MEGFLGERAGSGKTYTETGALPSGLACQGRSHVTWVEHGGVWVEAVIAKGSRINHINPPAESFHGRILIARRGIAMNPDLRLLCVVNPHD